MHQRKVLSARPKIEKGKKLLEPSFTLFLVLTVGPGIESTQMQVDHGLEWQDLDRLQNYFRLPQEQEVTVKVKMLLKEWRRILRLYSSKSRWRLEEFKKRTRKSTKRDKRSSDIYRMNPWKRPRTIKIRSNQISSWTSQFWKIRFSAQCSNSRQVTLKSNWARHSAINISATIGKFSMEL